MKLLTTLALTALLGSAAAFAQNTQAPESSSSATAPSHSATDSSGTAHGSSSSSAKSLAHTCKNKAKAQKLTGADKKQFMKDCEAGKTS